jgi:hypothetical protein
VAASGSAGNGPLKTFCAELRELQAASGLNVAALARKLNQDSHTIGKSQLYEILKGEIKTPPAWETVEPIVGACTRRDSVVIQQWRRRHDIMVGVWEELELQSKSGGPPGAQSAPTRVVRTLRPDRGVYGARGSARHHQQRTDRAAIITPSEGCLCHRRDARGGQDRPGRARGTPVSRSFS